MVHVTPVDEQGELAVGHELSADCFCFPYWRDGVIVHNHVSYEEYERKIFSWIH